jgi:hypothetical protein
MSFTGSPRIHMSPGIEFRSPLKTDACIPGLRNGQLRHRFELDFSRALSLWRRRS